MTSHILASLLVVFSLCLGTFEICIAHRECGAENHVGIGQSFTFSSPGYPSPYPSGLECRWTISSPENSVIELNCSDFQVEESITGCLDLFYVSAHSENGPNIPICAQTGNRYNNLTRLTTTNSLDVYFSSFGSFNISLRQAKGFECIVKVLELSIPEAQVVSECGEKELKSRIINGSEAQLHAWPWQVALLEMNPGAHEIKQHHHEQFCGGSLISANWVLTAAHCVVHITKDDVLVILGEHDLDTGLETNHTVERYVSEIIVHSGYMNGWGNLINDIAVLRLSKPVEYSLAITPVCLPTSSNFRNEMFDGKLSTVTGWGSTSNESTSNDLQEANLTIITNTACSHMFGKDIYGDQICANEEGKSTCNGDSGGPLVWKDENSRYQQIGIVSWGARGCPTKYAPGVFTRVTSYIDWIEEKTKTQFSYSYGTGGIFGRTQ